MSGVAWIAVAKIILDQAQVIAFVCQGEAAGMAEHVGVNVAKTCPLSCNGDHPVHGLSGQRLTAFGNKQPGQEILARGEPAAKGAQFVAGDRLLDGQAVLEPCNPKPRLGKIDIVAAERDRLRYSEPMPIHHEDQEMVANAMAAALGGIKQGAELSLTQKVATSFVGVGSIREGTVYISPVGHARKRPFNLLKFRTVIMATLYKIRLV